MAQTDKEKRDEERERIEYICGRGGFNYEQKAGLLNFAGYRDLNGNRWTADSLQKFMEGDEDA